MRRSMAITVVSLLLLGTLTAPAAASGVRADDGARVVASTAIGARTLDLTIESPALARTGKVRLLLPPDWSRRPHQRWPVLYLLHGCCDTYDSWTRETDVAALTSRTNVLVVMPEAGEVGMYSNWWNHGAGGPPAWETFHLREVRQIVERGYRAGTQRAIAGLSMGGIGAFGYPARNPGMFRAAASYSGLVHTRKDAAGLMDLVRQFGEDPLAVWGDPVRQRRIWAAHNPYDLAARLRGIPLYLSCGTGQPGPLDQPGTDPDGVEEFIHAENQEFTDRARRLGLRLDADLYGPGTHTWPYWERSLHRSFPMLMRAIGARGSERQPAA